MDRLDHAQTIAVLQPHIDHRESRGVPFYGGERLGHAGHQGGFEAPALERPAKPIAQRRVVVEHQQALIGQVRHRF